MTSTRDITADRRQQPRAAPHGLPFSYPTNVQPPLIELLKRVYASQHVKAPCHHRVMLTEEDARRLVLAEIDDVQGHTTYDLQILRVETLPFGWLFYWGAVWDGQNGQRPRLGGNGPFLVDRENERLIRTATSVPVARQIADYERRLRREAHARSTAAKQGVRQP